MLEMKFNSINMYTLTHSGERIPNIWTIPERLVSLAYQIIADSIYSESSISFISILLWWDNDDLSLNS